MRLTWTASLTTTGSWEMARKARRNQSNRTKMREVTLQEYVRSEPILLSAAELRTLQASKLSINIAPTSDREGEYRLTPWLHRRRCGARRSVGVHPAEDRHPATSLNGVLRH